MSAQVNGTHPPGARSSSSKKRKNDGEVAKSTKKRRKHAEVTEPAAAETAPISEKKEKENKSKKKDADTEESTALPETSLEVKDSKEKKRKTKDKKAEPTKTVSPQQESSDIELPDLPPVQINPTVEEAAEEEDKISQQEPLVNNDDEPQVLETFDADLLQSKDPSCFYSKRVSLYVSLPAIGFDTAVKSVVSLHLSPLLLTYFSPVRGIVLSFSDPVLSSGRNKGPDFPLDPPRNGSILHDAPKELQALCGNEFGVCWVWLTATFLVFRPSSGDAIKAWTNVQSEGFVGLVCYNYFQASVGKTRIPGSWVWRGPAREQSKQDKKGLKGRLKDAENTAMSQDDTHNTQAVLDGDVEGLATASGSFMDQHGTKVNNIQTFKVADVEMVPGHEKDKWTLRVDGSLLSPAEETAILAEERQRFEALQHRLSRSKTSGPDDNGTAMSGGLPLSREGSQF